MAGLIGLLIALIIIGVSLYIYRRYVLFPPTMTPEGDANIDSTVTANPLQTTTDAATAKPHTKKGSTESSEEAKTSGTDGGTGTSASDVNAQRGEGKKKKRKKKRSKRSQASKNGEKKKSKRKKSKREKKSKKEKEDGEKLEKSTELKHSSLIKALT